MNKEFLEKLIKSPSPTGQEDEVIKCVVDYTKDKAEDYLYDNQGSVSAIYNKDASFKVLVAAHSDEISLVVNGYNGNGSLTVDKNGGIRTKLYIGTKVRVISPSGMIYGVVGTNSALMKKADVDASDLFIDIGASSKDEAMKLVPVGTYVIHDTDMVSLQNDLLAARAFDDRLGVFIVQSACKKAYEMGSKNAIYATATTGEESTGRGAYSSAAIIKPNVEVIVDVTFATDSIGADVPGEVLLGKGGVICKGSIPNRKLNELLEKCAHEINEPVQFEVWPGRTGTDGDTMLKTNAGVPQVLFSIPLRYMHSPIEIASIKDIESMISVLAHFLVILNEEINLNPYSK